MSNTKINIPMKKTENKICAITLLLSIYALSLNAQAVSRCDRYEIFPEIFPNMVIKKNLFLR
jgi:hypothetical protein